jgi:hypothetical protein
MKKVIPFSNGTEAMWWQESNCDQCKRSQCQAKRNIEFGFITGEITIYSANFIGAEFSGTNFCKLNPKCKNFTTVSNRHYTKNLTPENTLNLFQS